MFGVVRAPNKASFFCATLVLGCIAFHNIYDYLIFSSTTFVVRNGQKKREGEKRKTFPTLWGHYYTQVFFSKE